MKKLLYLLFAAGMLTACQNAENSDSADNEKNAETEQEPATPMAHYGESFSPEGAISVADLEKQMEGKDSMITTVKAPIFETCSKMGCWMRVDLDKDEKMMVYMNDHSFFLPKSGVDGKNAIFTGKAFRDTVSVEMLQHYAEDAGKPQEEIDAITEPEYAMAFNATGVIIEDYEAKEEGDEEMEHHEGDGHMHDQKDKKEESKM